MTIVKSFSVGEGDMFYIKHGSNNFTIIDCFLNEENKETIVNEIIEEKKEKEITRFISTHPDKDHIGGLKYLDDKINILNFYCVKNDYNKETTEDYKQYYELRDDSKKAFYIYRNCKRKWMNENDEEKNMGLLVSIFCGRLLLIQIIWMLLKRQMTEKAQIIYLP